MDLQDWSNKIHSNPMPYVDGVFLVGEDRKTIMRSGYTLQKTIHEDFQSLPSFCFAKLLSLIFVTAQDNPMVGSLT